MKKSWKVSLLISLIVLLGAIVTGIITYSAYNKILKDSTRNIAELSAMNVYSEIDNELTKPIYVSLTMAHDSFVLDWLSREDDTNQDEIIDYLSGVQARYEYNSVFLVSANTNIYYYYGGINKVVSPDDSHDIWYYSFVNSSELYHLDVDVDEVTGLLTIFINAKLFDNSNQLAAVVGVGVQMNYVQNILSIYEDNYNLEVFLINKEGIIQSSTDVDLIEQKNIFDDFGSDISTQILGETDALLTLSNNNSDYIITRYIDDLDWYIIVQKNVNVFARFFIDYFWLSLIMIILVLTVVSNIIIITINQYQRRIYGLANTDYLTLLLNRRGFTESIEHIKQNKELILLFMIDVDGFKYVNDEFGHTFGDDILRYLGILLKKEVQGLGEISRWGGDEFIGYLSGNKEVTEPIILDLTNKIKNDDFLKDKSITISIGYTYTDFSESFDITLNHIDKALYEAKEKGGNTTVFKK